jgi:hypothetical protein
MSKADDPYYTEKQQVQIFAAIAEFALHQAMPAVTSQREWLKDVTQEKPVPEWMRPLKSAAAPEVKPVLSGDMIRLWPSAEAVDALGALLRERNQHELRMPERLRMTRLGRDFRAGNPVDNPHVGDPLLKALTESYDTACAAKATLENAGLWQAVVPQSRGGRSGGR